jgi:hypothetical protein
VWLCVAAPVFLGETKEVMQINEGRQAAALMRMVSLVVDVLTRAMTGVIIAVR